MILSLNGQESTVQTITDLHARLAGLRQAHRAEVDLSEANDPRETGTFFSMLMLTHDDRALLLYFRHDGDAGLTSRDPAHSGPPHAMLDFELSNGQVDSYPAYWTMPLNDAVCALEYAFLHRAPAPWVMWNDEAVQDSWDEWQARVAADGGDAS